MAGDQDPEDQEGGKLKDTLTGFLENVRRGSPNEGNPEDQEIVEEAEEEAENNNLPDIIIDRSKFEFELPQNRQDAESQWSEVEVGRSISERVLTAYKEGDMSDTTLLLRDWIQGENTVVQEVRQNRENLRRRLNNLENNLELSEGRTDGYHESWTMRLERVIRYLEFLDNTIQPARFGPSVIKDIYLGTGDFNVPDTERGFLNDLQGIEFTEVDDVDVPDGYTRNATYGLAHALEDLKKINKNHLSALVKKEEGEINQNYNTLNQILEAVRETEKSFNNLLKVRLNLEALERTTEVEQEIAEQAEVNQWSERMKNTLVSEEEGVHELQVKVSDLEKEEARVIQLFEETHEVLQRRFRIDEYDVQEYDHEEAVIENSPGPRDLFNNLMNRLDGDSAGLEQKIQEVLEQFELLENNLQSLRTLELADVENIMIAERLLENIIEDERNAYDLEMMLEDEEDEVIADEEETEIEMEDIVDNSVRFVENLLSENFEGTNPAKEFKTAFEELRDAHSRLSTEENLEERDLKQDEEIGKILQHADEVLTEMGRELEEKTAVENPEVYVEIDGEPELGHPTDVLEEIISYLSKVDNHLEDEISREDDEKQNILSIVQEMEDAYEKVQRTMQAFERVRAEKNGMVSELEKLPGNRVEEGKEFFWQQIDLIGSEKLSKVHSIMEHGEFQNLIEECETLLDQNTGVEKRELEVLNKISNIEGDIDNKVEKFRQAVERHDEMAHQSEIISDLQSISEGLNEAEQMTIELEENVSDELDQEGRVEEETDELDSFLDDLEEEDESGDGDDLGDLFNNI